METYESRKKTKGVIWSQIMTHRTLARWIGVHVLEDSLQRIRHSFTLLQTILKRFEEHIERQRCSYDLAGSSYYSI